MDWYNNAAEDFLDCFDNYQDMENTVHDLHQDNNTDFRFHFSGGMWFRNSLRNLGYADDVYGNLDDHYDSVLKIIYNKFNLK
jgi:hypothetical protein